MGFHKPLFQFLFATAIVLGLCSCQFERFFPDRVANGAARLTVNNLAKFVLALNDPQIARTLKPECRMDTTKGARIVQSGNGLGKAQWEFKDCEIDFGSVGTAVDTPDGCGGVTTMKLMGKVTYSGTRTISGILTFNKNVPVIPSDLGAVEIRFTKTLFKEFRVEAPSQESAMTLVSANVPFDVEIHMGQDTTGFCSVPLPNPTLRNIRYENHEGAVSTVRLPGVLGDFTVEIDASNMRAQVGVFNEIENYLQGTMTLWGQERRVPDTQNILDPSYDSEQYAKDLSCVADLQHPVPHQCSSKPAVAANVARLTIANLGNLLSAIVLDKKRVSKEPGCNFRNFSGGHIKKVGDHAGEGTWDFKCTYDFGEEGQESSIKVLDKTKTFTLFGSVTMIGQRRMSGRVTGNDEFPIIPSTGEMRIEFARVDFKNFTIESPDLPALRLQEGSIAFDLRIHLQKDPELQVYKEPLPNLTFEKVRYLKPMRTELIKEGEPFMFDVAASTFRAQVDRYGEDDNIIEGAISMFGKSVNIPRSKLVPEQEAILTPPQPHRDGMEKIEGMLADGAARLTVNNLARLVEAIVGANLAAVDGRPECRLRDLEKRAPYTAITRKEGSREKGTVTWRFENCQYDLRSVTQEQKSPELESISGTVTLSGERSLDGTLTGNDKVPVFPDKNFIIRVSKMDFVDYQPVALDLRYIMNMQSGSISFDVIIPLKEDPKTRVLSLYSPDITFQRIRYDNDARVIIQVMDGEMQGTFDVPVNGSDFSAQLGAQNKLSGSFSVFDSRLEIPTDKKGLNPKIVSSQTEEKDTHSHTNLESFEALMIARLLTLNLSSILLEAFSEDLKRDRFFPNCGFNSNRVKLTSSSEGDVGYKGRMTFRMSNCQIIDQAIAKSLPDPCAKNAPLIQGRVKASGTWVVNGLRTREWGFGIIPYQSIKPDNPHAVSFDFDNIEVDDFSTVIPSNAPGMSGGLTLTKGALRMKAFPVLAERKDEACNFSKTTPIATFAIAIDSDVEAILELKLHGQPLFKSKKLTINSANLVTRNGVFDGLGNSINGTMRINGSDFKFDANVDTLDPFYSQEEFDASYACRTQLDRVKDAQFYEDFAIRSVIPWQKGAKTTCPEAPQKNP